MDNREIERATAHLRERDPVMCELVPRVGPCRLAETQRRQPFPALVQAIIAQQISKHAADAIHGRFLALYGGRCPSARRLLATDEEQLRGAGLSRMKAGYLRDLASRVVSRQLPLARLADLTDEEVEATLTTVKGVGPWTAQVFMIFRLGRLDVLPVADLGLRDGARRLYDLEAMPEEEDLTRLAEPWRPYRSVGCWYLWHGRRLVIDG